MKVVMKGAGFFLLLPVALGLAVPGFAQAPETTPGASEQAGSVIVFPKFIKGTVAVNGVTKAQTEIEIRAQCPSGATCPEDEVDKDQVSLGLPRNVRQGFQLRVQRDRLRCYASGQWQGLVQPRKPQPPENNVGAVAPCASGYLVGWVINPDTERPIKYDGLTGSALLRDDRGVIESYEAFAIQADPNLTNRGDIATDIDPRTGIPALVFDGGAGHYQAIAGAVPANLEYHKLTGPLASGAGFLILLTLDVRLNRPNYPTFVDLDFSSDQGIRASTAWNFRCWVEIQDPNIGANFTLVGARTRDAVVISGRATKVAFGGVSDIPGPVTLLGLVPTDEGRAGRTMHPAYIVQRTDSGKPTTVFVPF